MLLYSTSCFSFACHDHFIEIFTVRNSSCGKVMFSQASVILSTGGGVHPPGQTPPLGRHPPPPADNRSCIQPPRQTPPWADTTPLGRHPPRQTPPGRHPPRQTPPPPPPPFPRRPLQRTVRILLECILVFIVYFHRPLVGC